MSCVLHDICRNTTIICSVKLTFSKWGGCSEKYNELNTQQADTFMNPKL